MMEQGGVLTEYTSQTEPAREHFPMRNRIIAGLSDALIVVESGTKGGSIITAEIANQYNKDVFAVPGRLKDTVSQGCNRLIKSHKAALIESAEDVSYIMRWESSDNKKVIQRDLFPDLSSEEQAIVNLIQVSEEATIDQLTYEFQMSNSEVASLLLSLEFKGLVKPLPGKRFVLV